MEKENSDNKGNQLEYPIQYIYPVILSDGTLVQLRPVHPIDGEQAKVFRSKLSDESLRNRFLGYIPNVSEKLVNQLTLIDYKKEMAIVAEIIKEDSKEAVAVARVVGEKDSNRAEFAIILADAWHGKGLGSKMTDYMIKVARNMEFDQLYALLFAHNTQMLEIFRSKGFSIKQEGSDTDCAVLDL